MNTLKTWTQDNWLKIIAILLIAGVLQPWLVFPFAYYQLMNWVVMGGALTVAYQANKQQKKLITWLFVLVGVVFNPITPFYLQPNIWRIADIVVIALFLLSFLTLRPNKL